MTTLQRQVRVTQRRLWLNRWLHHVCFCLAVAGAAFAGTVLVQRLFALPWPVAWICGALALLAGGVSVIWMLAGREDSATAAARLDQAAGLQERISSGLHCQTLADPFAQAVVSDAERISASISPRTHVRLEAPRPLGWTAGSFVLAALMFLISPGALVPRNQQDEAQASALTQEAKVAVKRQMDEIKRMTAEIPALQEFKDDVDPNDTDSGGALRRPGDIRHEALKKIDKLEDAVKEKRASSKYAAVRDMRKLLRNVKEPDAADAPTQKLAKALQQADFKAAKEEIKALKEQLATLKMEEDKELVEKLGKQLDELAKQLEQAAAENKLAEKLEQSGIKKEDLDRLLEDLKKKDLEQIAKDLEQKGMTPQQAQKLAEALKKQQAAGELAKKLAQAMQKSGQACSAGAPGDAAAAGLQEAGDQLSELEMLELEMNQMDGALADMQGARDAMGKPCSTCAGSGMKGGKSCSACGGSGQSRQGSGGGMGKMGRGRGGLAPEQSTDVAFKTEREKVHTGKGAIIGQVLFDGEQVKGDVDASVVQVMTAAERDASDRINRDRIPRQYQKAVRTYFSTAQKKMGVESSTPEPDEVPEEESGGSE